MIYRIYTETNFADTCRDPDEIQIVELGYKKNLKDALKIANNYIKTKFFHNDTKLRLNQDGSYSAVDFRSYGAKIVVKPIKLR